MERGQDQQSHYSQQQGSAHRAATEQDDLDFDIESSGGGYDTDLGYQSPAWSVNDVPNFATAQHTTEQFSVNQELGVIGNTYPYGVYTGFNLPRSYPQEQQDSDSAPRNIPLNGNSYPQLSDTSATGYEGQQRSEGQQEYQLQSTGEWHETALAYPEQFRNLTIDDSVAWNEPSGIDSNGMGDSATGTHIASVSGNIGHSASTLYLTDDHGLASLAHVQTGIFPTEQVDESPSPQDSLRVTQGSDIASDEQNEVESDATPRPETRNVQVQGGVMGEYDSGHSFMVVDDNRYDRRAIRADGRVAWDNDETAPWNQFQATDPEAWHRRRQVEFNNVEYDWDENQINPRFEDR